MANDVILEDPDHIGVLDCACRLTRKSPCLPLNVCMAIGEPFVGFLENFKTNNFRRITPEEAAEILRA
ncbi:MAG: hypothetical protein SWK76_02265 [Actinomycetota bacterium]|nr:hypothetical protein [Actinomycetota bacterium]